MGGRSRSVTVGYWYYMGLHMALCHGPVDAVREIRAGGRTAWSGEVTSSTRIRIEQPELWGGEKREGGLVGDLDILMGDAEQLPNDYLASRIGGVIPAFRGVLSLVWRGGRIAAMNPYIKPWEITVTRLPQRHWQTAYAEPSPGDANPAHIIREAITSTAWGMGYPEHMIDEASFAAAARTLHAEGFGLSLIYRQQGSIEAFIQEVLDHIGGALRQDPVSGLWQLALIRDDYDVEDLPVLDPSTAVLELYERAAYGEAPNEITVLYTDPDTLEETAVTVQSIAHIDAQGAVISETRRYPGIRSHAIAQRVAMRDLRAVSTPLARVRLRARRGYDLLPGDAFLLRWPPLGIDGLVCRVGRIGIGSLASGEYTIEAAEDVFGLPAASYVAQQPIGWVDPATPPAPCPRQRAEELPWWEIVRTLSAADLDYLPDDIGYLRAWGSRPSSDAVSYELLTTAGGAYERRDTGDWPPYLELAEAIPLGADDVVVPYGAAYHAELIEIGSYGVIGDEYVAIIAIDTVARTITLGRGVHDTVPQSHAAGEILWVIDDHGAVDETQWVEGETVAAKLLPTTTRGTLDESAATPMQVQITGRAHRPYPPGGVRINGQSYPTYIQGALTVAWHHRDRTQQTADIVPQSAGDIGPEPGTTYTLRLYGETGSLARTESSISGTSYSWTTEEDDCLLPLPGGGQDVVIIDTFDGPSLDQAWSVVHLDGTGSATIVDGALVVDSAGSGDFWQSADGGSIVYRAMGPGTEHEAIVRVDTTSIPGWSRLLMARESADPRSPFVAAHLSLNTGRITPVWRSAYGAAATFAEAGTVAYQAGRKLWIRALYDGETISWWTSQDGPSGPWASAGSLAISGLQLWCLADSMHGGGIAYGEWWQRRVQPPLRRNNRVTLALGSVRDGLASHQQHEITVIRVGYGYSYGHAYGGL